MNNERGLKMSDDRKSLTFTTIGAPLKVGDDLRLLAKRKWWQFWRRPGLFVVTDMVRSGFSTTYSAAERQ